MDLTMFSQATDIHGVFHSTLLVQPELKERLRAAVSILEDVPLEELDWHPGSNDQVLDLVHPSLYCYRVGQSISRGLPVSSQATEYRVLSKEDYLSQYDDLRVREWSYEKNMLSMQHQWLPTDFDVSASGEVTPVTYIHNLHPITHRDLYAPISAVLQRLIPLFEEVLTDALAPAPRVIVPDATAWYSKVEHLRPDYGTSKNYQPELNEFERLHEWPEIPDGAPLRPSSQSPPAR